jgi:uncharacterized phage protein (TIGR02220 family)
MDERAQRIFEYWRAQMGYGRCRPVESRMRHIRARLADGFTEDELRRVIDYVRDEPWWRGHNDRGRAYDDIENIFRNTARVERFLHDIDRKGRSRAATNVQLMHADKPTGPGQVL